MKGFIASLLFVLAFASVPGFAARGPETLRVQVNKEKRAPQSRLNVRFVELIEDSRCPADANCVWAGNAKIKIRVSKGGRSQEMTLDTNGRNSAANFDNYSIKLVNLTPHPRSNIRINRNGYVATIMVTRLSR